jgi:cyanophycin synthetase
VVDTVERMPAGRKWALFGSAGDRSDEEIAGIATGVCSIKPDHVVIVEVEQYLRGRAPGEVSEIMKQACLDSGTSENQLGFADSPLSGVKLALAQMQADELGLFLVLSERDEVISLLHDHC